MNVRPYRPEDNAALVLLFTETVRAINAADYSSEQLEIWANSPPDVEHWRSQLDGRIALVAEDDSEIIGFATFEPNGHLDHLYVSHPFQRRGVASALLQRIEEESISRGIERIFTEASATACPFFEHIGFRMIAPQDVAVKGISLRNYRMERFLA
jgi:putative acetyltransferase